MVSEVKLFIAKVAHSTSCLLSTAGGGGGGGGGRDNKYYNHNNYKYTKLKTEFKVLDKRTHKLSQVAAS